MHPLPLPEIGRGCVAALVTAILVWAAVSDIKDRRIPNRAVIAILVLFVPWALLSFGWPQAWALVAGVIALAIGVSLYATKIIGAGDAKLFAALALFAGMERLLLFALLTALAGGVIAIVSLAARPQRALVMFTLRGKGDFGPGIPYGVAIAIAAAGVLWAPILKLPLPMGAAA